jgi:hypothetical protein
MAVACAALLVGVGASFRSCGARSTRSGPHSAPAEGEALIGAFEECEGVVIGLGTSAATLEGRTPRFWVHIRNSSSEPLTIPTYRPRTYVVRVFDAANAARELTDRASGGRDLIPARPDRTDWVTLHPQEELRLPRLPIAKGAPLRRLPRGEYVATVWLGEQRDLYGVPAGLRAYGDLLTKQWRPTVPAEQVARLAFSVR